jgi:hypothetical protein
MIVVVFVKIQCNLAVNGIQLCMYVLKNEHKLRNKHKITSVFSAETMQQSCKTGVISRFLLWKYHREPIKHTYYCIGFK